MEPLYADAFTNVGRTILNFLAIAGGFLIGYVLTHIILRIIAKFALKDRLPLLLERALQVLGGILVAFLVALLVFGDGSWGFGGSGGGRPGGPGGESIQQPDPGEQKDPPTPPRKKEDEKLVPTAVETIVVMKASPNPTAFRFESDKEVMGIAKAKKRLDDIKASAGKTLVTLLVKVYKNSASENNPDVREFRRYADSIGLPSNVVTPDQLLDE